MLSGLPGGIKLNHSLQICLGELRDFERHVDMKVTGEWVHLMKYLHRAQISVTGLDILEIGTGWHPALPFCFSLVGGNSCRTYDIVRHMDQKLTMRMFERLGVHLGVIAEAAGVERAQVETSYATLRRARDMQDLLHLARIKYIAPGNAVATGLLEDSVDLIYSNSVLEHVHTDVLAGLMAESVRILRVGGCVAHCVACNDHYAHFDKNISCVNYLRYSPQSWRVWNNNITYQNRLRASDFIRIACAGGLSVIQVNMHVRDGVREALATLPIAPEFLRYTPEDLETTSVDFIATKKRSPPLMA